MKFCKGSNRFVIIFIKDSVSSSSGCSKCLYSKNNVSYRDIAAITTLWPVECFPWSLGGAWIGHLHHLAPHQLCSLNQPTRTNYTCKRCKTMEQCHQYQLKLEFWSHVYPQTIHPHCTVCVQFVMLTGEWNDYCFLYQVPSYHLRTSSPSSLSPRPCLLCQCQRFF